VFEVVYHHAKFGGFGLHSSPAAGAAKYVEFFVCLFVCPSRLPPCNYLPAFAAVVRA